MQFNRNSIIFKHEMTDERDEIMKYNNISLNILLFINIVLRVYYHTYNTLS